MSFASEIKSELLRIEDKKHCCKKAELCGLIAYCGTENKGVLRISTENAATARRGFSLIKEITGISGEIRTNHSRAGKGGNAYSILIENRADTMRLLAALNMLDGGGIRYRIGEAVSEESCCRRAFLRGAFLGGGSIANPEKEYHLEFSTGKEILAEETASLFANFALSARIIKRKSNFVVYFKNSEEIGDVLNIIGAHSAYMEYMNVRILKETRNKVNRRVNCENANMDKTVDAAQRQLTAIRRLKKRGKFDTLSPALRETGRLRLENPEMPLSEIAAALGVTKSCINHRMRRLIEMGESLS